MSDFRLTRYRGMSHFTAESQAARSWLARNIVNYHVGMLTITVTDDVEEDMISEITKADLTVD